MPVLRMRSNIVSGRDELQPSLICELHEPPQLHSFVATHARVGRCPGHVSVKKVADDPGAKRGTGIDDLMRNAEGLGDMLGNAYFAAPPSFHFFEAATV